MSSSVKIMAGATVCEDCVLRGDVTVLGGAVVHPRACIVAEGGPVLLSEYCIVEEYAHIVHLPDPSVVPSEHQQGQKPLLIGPHNVFEVGCRVESYAGHIGESNVFECKSYVGPKVIIGSGCVIGAGCRLEQASLSDNTIVYGSEHLQREALEKQPSQMLQLDFLSKIIPNYHKLRKPNVQVKRHPAKPTPDL